MKVSVHERMIETREKNFKMEFISIFVAVTLSLSFQTTVFVGLEMCN